VLDVQIARQQSVRDNDWMTPEELKELRSKYGFTQAQLAGRLGKNARTVARWEARDTVISDELADRIRGGLALERKPLDLTRATATELAMELLKRAQQWDRLETQQSDEMLEAGTLSEP
jgi:transcriptional regulator with XRE-family HTH domain